MEALAVDRPLEIMWPAPGLANKASDFAHGYALVIGVSEQKYSHIQSLPVTAKDAEAIAALGRHRNGYRVDNVQAMTGKDATLARIKAEFDWLKARTAADDKATVTVY